MSDDLDDLLRRTMKTLDDQVPAGYFEALPDRTLARLSTLASRGDASMQPTGTDRQDDEAPAAPASPDEDSGLHDIRNLASSQRLRLSSKRSSQNPPLDDDLIASSSAGWKAVALPEPAKMVTLTAEPAPTERSSAEQLDKAERTSKDKLDRAERSSKDKLDKAERSSKDKLERASRQKLQPVAVPAVEAAVPAAPPAADAGVVPITMRVARPKPSGGNRGALYAVSGVAVAVAAGAAIFITTRKHADEVRNRAEAQDSVAAPMAAAPPAPAAQIATEVAPADAGAAEATGGMAAGSASAIESPPAPPVEAVDARPTKPEPKTKAPGKTSKAIPDEPGDKIEKPRPPDPGAVKKRPDKGQEGGEPSFDDLLKEAGVDGKKEPARPKLDKTSLSGDDMKKGMNGVAAKAQACYAGTQGTANVKLTVSPSGRVQKVTVTGAFAGTAVGNCVEAAVKSATFPPWDGPPQSFGFSYLLSE